MLRRINDTLYSIRNKIGAFTPEIGIVLGSGLGSFADSLQIIHTIPYSTIDHFPVSTVAGHSGRLIFGELFGKHIVAMQGRFHYYEGYTPDEIVLPIRIMKLLGVKTLLLSNAAGGLNETFATGDIMAITDHICFIPNPLIGPNIDAFGPRFPEMGNAYSSKLLQLAKDISQEYQLNIHEGCYVAVTGPSYETPAEVAFYRQIGGDAVGMSTAPEVIAARHAGMEVFALSVITNQAAQKNSVPPSHEEVMREGKKAENKVRCLLTEMIKRV